MRKGKEWSSERWKEKGLKRKRKSGESRCKNEETS